MNTKIYHSAIRCLARRAHHSEELRKKLIQKGASKSDVEEVIQKLLALRYLNDQLYIQNYIFDSLLRKPQSLRVIKQKLRLRGVPQSQIEPEISQYEATEEERAQKALSKKRAALKGYSPLQQKQKIARFLASRGFNREVVVKVTKKLL